MKITQDVRDYAATLNDPDKRAVAVARRHVGLGRDRGWHGADEREVQEMGSSVYLDAEKVKESNRCCEAPLSPRHAGLDPGIHRNERPARARPFRWSCHV